MDLPFDSNRLDRLMDEAGIDILLVTSKHNVQYLLGGHKFFWFEHMDAVGISRYLPVLGYVRDRPGDTFYIANELEQTQLEVDPVWVEDVIAKAWTSIDAIDLASEKVAVRGLTDARIGVESAFLPMDSHAALAKALPSSTIVDGSFVLERLRAVKSPAELVKVEEASDLVVDAMLAVMASCGNGSTKREIAQAFGREQVGRGLTYEYCLISCGTSLNRAPSDQRWLPGEILSMDSGGNMDGYIGDLARMAILGEPDAELVDLLGQIDAVQMAAREPIRAGARGADIYDVALESLATQPDREHLVFLAHGMGLISHEAPRLTATGPIPYPAYDADRPLEAGMVISIETTMPHPTRGFIKLEDTVIVTDNGYRAVGDIGRSWNVVNGTA